MSALTSSSGGSDNLQVGVAVFCIVISLVTTMMVPIFAPDYDTGYSYEDVYSNRMELEAFTGESMTTQSPWMLTGVYTPYVEGGDYNITEEGWLYGESVDYQYIGQTTNIRFDPNMKSETTFSSTDTTVIEQQNKWYYDTDASGLWGLNWAISKWFGDLTGNQPTRTESVEVVRNTWEYTGYRYEFDPMMTIVSGEGGEKQSETDAKLSIIWYDTGSDEGFSGGLILYDDMNKGIVSNISANEIVTNYNVGSNYSSKFTFDFNGTKVAINVKFDADVLKEGVSLEDAFSDGRWSMALTATTADSLLNIADSNTLSTSIGNILETYLDIFTFDIPNMPTHWSMVLWIVCILPGEIVVMMFLSRFGVAGLLAGVIGNVLLGAFA